MEDSLSRSFMFLTEFIFTGIKKNMDSERIARAGKTLSPNQQNLFFSALDFLIKRQQADGGWVDVEESAWCLAYLRDYLNTDTSVSIAFEKGVKWLKSQQRLGKGWGRNERDFPRIPYTSWVATFVPEVVSKSTLQWLEEECSRELDNQPCLTYKISLPLLAFTSTQYVLCDPLLNTRMIDFLVNSQNKDGGFAPWRDHPCGSDPWCTGLAVLALLSRQQHVSETVFQMALGWLVNNQLPNGSWPYHYIDEGTAIAYWALRELAIRQVS